MPRSPESFDALYASTRQRLLHECYALTGDIAASRGAVRDTFVVGWHHWRKLSLVEDQEAWLRPLAHGRARRRHSARPWHRDKSLDEGLKATLDGLAHLSAAQRQLLVLSTLSPLRMAEIARAVGLPLADAERELDTAAARFALERDVAPTSVTSLIQALGGPVADHHWPRATIIRRTGAARRRTHTFAGAGLALVAVLVSGSLVATGTDAAPTGLSVERATESRAAGTLLAEPEMRLDEETLLAEPHLIRFGPRLDWTETTTSDNLGGDGLVLPCQQERFADPDGLDARVRTWEGTEDVVEKQRVRRGGKVRVTRKRVTALRTEAAEVVELSATEDEAERAYAVVRSWFAGCLDPRVQLVSTRKVKGVGDAAVQFRLRSWGKRPASLTAGIARSGQLTVTTLVRTRSRPVADKTAVLGLASAVNRLCGAPGTGTCAERPRSRFVEPFAIGEPPGLLSAVDLPPVQDVVGPWVGTDPDKARTNWAATRCDRTSFQQKGIRRALTRTFLFPERKVADEFGLTQTVGSMKIPAARRFVDVVRTRIRACGEANLGTTVTSLASRVSKHQELTAWALSVEVSDARAVTFLMAIVRDGNTVSQIGFTPVGKATLSRADFVGVAQRALQRLSNLPGSRR